jgi:hypothetical protein
MNPDIQAIRNRLKQKDAAKKVRADKVRAATKYRAIINIDFTNPKQNEYQRLVAALLQIGWKYLETSALAFEGELANVLVAMELLSKQCETAGTLSALTFHIQGSTNLNGKPYRQSKSYPNALRDIRTKPLPEPIIPS